MDGEPRYYEGGLGTAASHEYACTLHRRRCGARGCTADTALHPVCPAHAPAVFGVRVAPGRADAGLGLFATTAFRPGDPLVPYLGRRHPVGAIRCPDAPATAAAPRPDSPYALRMGTRWVWDTSCCRSYGGMANHPAPPRRANAAFCYCTVRAGRVRASRPVRRPRPLCGGAAGAVDWVGPDAAGAGTWLVATRPIAPGDEILVHYGPNWRWLVYGTRHSTAGGGRWWSCG